MAKTPTIIFEKILHKGWNTLSQYTLSLEDADGKPVTHPREITDHGHAAAILLVNRERQCVTLVRQFRLPAHLSGDEGMMLEVAAGLLEGEAPEACARREALEETGIAPKVLHHAFDIYASPGSLTEKVYCFVGLHDEADRIAAGGGLAEEGEEIEIVEIKFADLLPMIRSGAIADAKSVALIQHAVIEGFVTP